jgi:Cu/Ag efflux protein CusF
VAGADKEHPMLRTFALALASVLVLSVGLVMAAEKSEKGKIKKVDADKNTITVTIGDKDKTFEIGKDVKFVDAKGESLKDGIKNTALKEGTEVEVTCDVKDDKATCTKIALTK